MTNALETLSLALFVPADRPDRYAKAFAAGADAVILDLEDAVSPAAKSAARAALVAAQTKIAAAPRPALVRINPLGSRCGEEDLALVAGLPIAGVVVAKAESVDDVRRAATASGRPVIALIESAAGLAAARSLAAACARLAFGSIDYADDLGCGHTRAALLAARSEIVIASRLAGRPGPLDGVTTATRDRELVRADAAYAAELGFAGKLLIHPAQVAPAVDGFRPSGADVDWARRILAACPEGGAASVDGAMVDRPVRLRAERIITREARFGPPAV